MTTVVGLDGGVPIQNLDNVWHTWALHEIYLGQEGTGKYVPKVKDHVKDTDTGDVWKVTAVNPITLIPTLSPVSNNTSSSTIDTSAIAFGVGPSIVYESLRLYIDNRITPHPVWVDAMYKVSGTMITKARIIIGSETNGSAEVISGYYDQNGDLTSQDIYLEIAVLPGLNNVTEKTVPVCYTNREIPDGEIATIIFYSDTGNVVHKRQLLVENTSFIQSSNINDKYITAIGLESMFLSQDGYTLNYPQNMNLNSLNLVGVVTYNNGEKVKLPINQTKFSIFGFENFVASIIGEKFKLILKYSLNSNEYVTTGTSNVISNGVDRFITKEYESVVTPFNGSYTVKLFAYPEYINSVVGYRMKYWLCNLDRDIVYDVTQHVTLNANSNIFNGISFGTEQVLNVGVNLNEVNGVFGIYRHVQVINVVLLANGNTANNTNWQVKDSINQVVPYGINCRAKQTVINANLAKLNFTSVFNTQTEWLTAHYYNTKPLVNPITETAPVVPDYFSFFDGVTEIVLPVSFWNTDIEITNPLQSGSNVYLKFLKMKAGNNAYNVLGVTGVNVI